MAVVVPKNVVEAAKEAKVSITMPEPTFKTEHKPDGSMIARVSYDEGLIQHLAKQLSDQLDEAIIDELARANGYVKKGE